MTIRDIKINTKEKLRGKYFEALVLLYAIIFISVNLYLFELFIKIPDYISVIINFSVLTPMFIGAGWWFAKTTEKKYFVENVDFLKIITNVSIVTRGILLSFILLLIQAVFFTAIITCINGAYNIFCKA
ncbi:MAG: hypothetical protein LBM93_01775, partial [Oscillospiraceae bacterium]|nr:hypothetical protein [Oscillospiraceae bacterium]